MPASLERVHEISILEIFRAILRGWWIIGAMLALALSVGLYLIKSATPQFTAQSRVLPVGQDAAQSTTGLAAALNQQIFARQSQRWSIFFAILHSYSLAERLEREYGMLKKIYASRWDEDAGTWREIPPRKLDPLRHWLGISRPLHPSINQLRSYLSSNIQILKDDSPITTITFQHPDPQFAKSFLALVIQEAENLSRERDIRRAKQRIEYIDQQLSRVQKTSAQQVLIRLLEKQYQIFVVASTDGSYMMELFEPTLVSETPTSPQTFRIFMQSIIAGLVLGIIGTLLFHFRRSSAGEKLADTLKYAS